MVLEKDRYVRAYLGHWHDEGYEKENNHPFMVLRGCAGRCETCGEYEEAAIHLKPWCRRYQVIGEGAHDKIYTEVIG